MKNLGLVHSIVKKFINNPTAPLYQELYSEGVTGLVEAAKRYRPEKAKFATYAYYRIQGAVLNYLQSKTSLIRVPKRNNKNEAPVAPNIVSLSAKQGEDSAEAQQMDVPVEDNGYSFVELAESVKKILTEYEYKILMMKYEGYSQVEIGKLLDKSDAAVSKIVVGIRHKLQPMLAELGYSV